MTPPVSPMVADTSTPIVAPDSVHETITTPSISPVLQAGGVLADPGPDLSREGPFNACDVVPDAGQSPLVLDSMAGCQYRMTSYEERTPSSDMDPSYGIHMHDPRVIEYMGAPESARLMGRTPEYWLQHMGRERTIQAALRLHHDASLIMTNIQIMSQLATSFSRAASEVMRTIHDREPFPTEAVDLVTPGRQVRRAAHYMESARLMGRTPEYWLQHMGRERTIQAALRLHHDASLIMTNIQIMSQLATSFSRAASEVMRTIHDREPFPTEAVDLVTPGRQVRRAAHYMAAMGLWRPTSTPVFPGPVSASSCNSCMACDDCFPDGGK